MCKLLNIPRATLYYAKKRANVKPNKEDSKLVNTICKIKKAEITMVLEK